MADLIRASALKRAMAESCALPEWVRALVNCVIDDQETADAIEVVRCKDCTGCRKRNRGDVRENTYAADVFWCDVLDAPVFLEDYCSSGCLAERGGDIGMKIEEILPCVCCDHIPDCGDSVYYGMPQLRVCMSRGGKQRYEPYCPVCGRGGSFQYDSAYHAIKAWNELQKQCRRIFDNPFVKKEG